MMKEKDRGVRADKKRVKEIYGGKCANFDQCQSKEKPHIHHIIFRSDGLSKDVTESKANYIAICWFCERLVHELAR